MHGERSALMMPRTLTGGDGGAGGPLRIYVCVVEPVDLHGFLLWRPFLCKYMDFYMRFFMSDLRQAGVPFVDLMVPVNVPQVLALVAIAQFACNAA